MNIKGIDLLTQFLNPLADSAQSLLFSEDIRQLHCTAGRGLLTGKGASDGPEQLTVFDASSPHQCHQAVMDGSFIPIGQVLQNRRAACKEDSAISSLVFIFLWVYSSVL